MSIARKVKDGRSLKWDQIKKEARDMHIKSAGNEVRHIDPESGEEIEAKPVEVNDLTRVLRYLGSYKGNTPFLKSIKWKIKNNGIASLNEKQIQAVINVMEYRKNLKAYQKRKITGNKKWDKEI